MYPPQAHAAEAHAKEAQGAEDPSYKVKNTFLEFSIPEENEALSARKRRTRSDHVDIRHSPLVLASKSPTGSPLLQPVDETMQAVPIDDVCFELLEEAEPIGSDPSGPSKARCYSDASDGMGQVAQSAGGVGKDEPAYVVPTTPSPFLHSSFAPTVVPPFGGFGYGLPEMGLPPAFGTEGDQGCDGVYGLQDGDGNYMQGIPFMPEMYDPNYGAYMNGMYGWPGCGGDGSYGPMDGQAEGMMDVSGMEKGDAPGSPLNGASPDECGYPQGASLQDQGGIMAEVSHGYVERAPKEGRRGKGRKGDEEKGAERKGGGSSGGQSAEGR
eukprot:CAMPEP_0180509662 /NCGR_PEP_ID=MMETSP1036_2-20121128/49849_1 /TAXON_ID=632150 /ORGANISM="Azadinium spinosum, Strain 3D9" /LENGTH=324 /DNA_ID=CAMNT_0022520099 /DNA_START=183 /DNA_END=1154 /DNA_ORIENTATION=-